MARVIGSFWSAGLDQARRCLMISFMKGRKSESYLRDAGGALHVLDLLSIVFGLEGCGFCHNRLNWRAVNALDIDVM